MPIVRNDEAIAFEIHGSTFRSFVAPARGATQLCAWRLEVPAGCTGVAHTPDRDEVLLVLGGALTVTLDGRTSTARAGDAIHVPAGTLLRVDTGDEDAAAWVTTTPGLRARTADGGEIVPPWAN